MKKIRNIKYYSLITFFVLSCIQNNLPNKLKPEYVKFTNSIGELNYRILYPKDFDKTKSYPLTLFLHGISERGDDNELQLKYIDKVFLDSKNYNKYHSVVIFPQAPLDDNWSSRIKTDNELRYAFSNDSSATNSLSLVIKLMDSISNESYVDIDRIYLTGLSNGAMGSFELLKNRPNMFAGAVLICGGGVTSWAKEFAKKTPVWIAHGSNDDVISPSFSLNMAEAIIKHGGSPKLTFYENVRHESWFNVFEDPNYLDWLFSKSKN